MSVPLWDHPAVESATGDLPLLALPREAVEWTTLWTHVLSTQE